MKGELLSDIIIEAAERYKNKRVFSMRPKYRTIHWRYRDLFRFALGISKMLEEQGIKRGDRVMLWATNSPYWLGAFFGCLLRGVIVVPLHTENTQDFIDRVAKETEPKLFFKSSDLELDHYPAQEINIDFLDNLLQQDALPKSRDLKVSVDPDDIVQILYTSGTTGDPKGVVLTHRNIVSNLESVHNIIPISSNDRILSILPLSHIFEQIVEFRSLKAGAWIVYAPSLSSSVIRDLLKEYHITKMAVVPEFLKRVLSRMERTATERGRGALLDFLFSLSARIPSRTLRRIIFRNVHQQFGGALNLVVSGGAALDPEIARKWDLLGMRIIQGYGLTETSPVISTLSPGDKKFSSVGRVVPNVEVKIAEGGEIIVRGPNVTHGYWKNEEKTKEAFTPDGWFRTGDLGSFDKNNHLSILGRKKFVILTPSGQNVYPQDIEAELNKEEGIEDSAVVALEKDSTTLIHAVLLGNPKDPESLIDRVNSRLATFQKIQSWSLWLHDDFPRTITRKVKRHKVLVELISEQRGGETVELEENAVPLRKLIAEVIHQPVSSIDLYRPLAAQGLDSLARIELVALIEEEFGVTIDEVLITYKTNIKDLEDLIAQRPASKVFHTLPTWSRSVLVQSIRLMLSLFIVGPVVRLISPLKIEGKDVLRGLKGPVVFMPNHISDLDGVVVFQSLPIRFRDRLTIATAVDVLFEKFSFIMPLITLFFNTYPFSRYQQPRIGFLYTGELIDKGWSILYFPEGQIPDDANEIIVKEGAGVIGVEMQVPIVPVKIEGTDKVIPHGTHFPRRREKVKIKFGESLRFSKETSYADAAQQIEDAIKNL